MLQCERCYILPMILKKSKILCCRTRVPINYHGKETLGLSPVGSPEHSFLRCSPVSCTKPHNLQLGTLYPASSNPEWQGACESYNCIVNTTKNIFRHWRHTHWWAKSKVSTLSPKPVTPEATSPEAVLCHPPL